jgi:hypothetical protein
MPRVPRRGGDQAGAIAAGDSQLVFRHMTPFLENIRLYRSVDEGNSADNCQHPPTYRSVNEGNSADNCQHPPTYRWVGQHTAQLVVPVARLAGGSSVSTLSIEGYSTWRFEPFGCFGQLLNNGRPACAPLKWPGDATYPVRKTFRCTRTKPKSLHN